jgi:hypothetical protein
MENNGIRHARFGWKDGLLILTTLTSVIGVLIQPGVRALVANAWAWVYFIWLCYLIYYLVYRYIRAKRWLKAYKREINDFKDSLNSSITGGEARMDATIQEFKASLDNSRAEWARKLRELIEDAVQYKANLATVEKEAKDRAEADSEINRQLDAIRSQLPPVAVS